MWPSRVGVGPLQVTRVSDTVRSLEADREILLVAEENERSMRRIRRKVDEKLAIRPGRIKIERKDLENLHPV